MQEFEAGVVDPADMIDVIEATTKRGLGGTPDSGCILVDLDRARIEPVSCDHR